MTKMTFKLTLLTCLLVIKLIEAAPTDSEVTKNSSNLDQHGGIVNIENNNETEIEDTYDLESNGDDVMVIMPVGLAYMRYGGYGGHRGGGHGGGNRGGWGGGHRGGWDNGGWGNGGHRGGNWGHGK